jgi:hypothetical protein
MFFIYLLFIYLGRNYFDVNKILCMVKYLFDKLNKNRLKIIHISENMCIRNSHNLSFELLLEMTKRSNSYQQI